MPILPFNGSRDGHYQLSRLGGGISMNIYQKLIEVRKEVPYLQKENAGAQYKYVSSSQVLGNLKAKMDELGLLLIPSVSSHKVTESIIERLDTAGSIDKRTTTYFTEIDMIMTWINAEKPEEKIACSWYGQGVDIAGEKGVGKAMTYAEKYFMLKFFNIPTDKDDPDAFQRKMEDEPQQKPPSSKPSTQRPNSTPSQAPNATVTDAQLKRLFAISKAHNVPDHVIKAEIQKLGKSSSKELNKAEYDAICAFAENYKIPPVDAVEDLFSGAKMPEKTMKAIHARAAEIGMNHDDLRSYAQCQYPIKSLKDLNEEQGKALLADLRALPDLDKAVGA
jgi:hypothetical protein